MGNKASTISEEVVDTSHKGTTTNNKTNKAMKMKMKMKKGKKEGTQSTPLLSNERETSSSGKENNKKLSHYFMKNSKKNFMTTINNSPDYDDTINTSNMSFGSLTMTTATTATNTPEDVFAPLINDRYSVVTPSPSTNKTLNLFDDNNHITNTSNISPLSPDEELRPKTLFPSSPLPPTFSSSSSLPQSRQESISLTNTDFSPTSSPKGITRQSSTSSTTVSVSTKSISFAPNTKTGPPPVTQNIDDPIDDIIVYDDDSVTQEDGTDEAQLPNGLAPLGASATTSGDGIYHGNGLSATQNNNGDDTGSICSESVLSLDEESIHTNDLDSISNYMSDSSLTNVSLTSSIASLKLKRRRIRARSSDRTINSFNNSSTLRLSTKKSDNPTAQNAFETLPRHLIKTALVRQASTTLRDERFIKRRIEKLGMTRASKVHASDFECFYKRMEKDEDYVVRTNATLPSSSKLKDGETVMSVMMESFELFRKCTLNLCGVEFMDVGDDHDGEGDEMREDAASGNKVQLRHLPLTTAEEEKVGISIGSSTTTRKEGQHADDSTYFPPLDSGKALFCLGKFLHKKEFNDDAMSFYRYALFLLLQELEISEPSLLDDSMDCSGFFYVDVAEVGKTACTPAHQDLAHLLTKMGDVHGKFMEVNDAMHAYRAAQVFWTRFLADHEIHSIVDCETTDDMDLLDEYADAVEGLALTHNRIGGVYCTRGELNLALNSFHEALDLQVDVLGPSHLEVAKTLHNIGVAHRHNNELDEALDYYTKAHRIFEQNLGRDNLDTVRTLHNIGGVYRRRKEYEKALSCFREVIKVRRSLLGDGHPSVSITLVSMAAVLRRSGKAEEANKFYAAAMK